MSGSVNKTIKIKPSLIEDIPEGACCVACKDYRGVPFLYFCRFYTQEHSYCFLFQVDLTKFFLTGLNKTETRCAYKNWQCIEAGKEAKLAEYDWDGLECL